MESRRLAPIFIVALALLCVLAVPEADAKIVAYGAPTVQAQAGFPVRAYLAYFTTTRESTQPEEISITIDWGDGTVTAGSVVNDGSGRFWVFGEHAYSETGFYPVKVKIFDPIMGFGTSDMRPGTM
ncbi:MAG: hypothetical protein ACM3JH_05290 [Acidithiobacillales bacterium]